MSPSPFIEHQASHWLARLDSGEMSEQDRIALQEWMAADPQHRKAVTGLENAWRRTEFLATLSEQDKRRLMGVAGEASPAREGALKGMAAAVGARGTSASRSNTWVTRVMAVAAAVLVAVICLVVVHQAVPGEIYRTGVGEQRQLALADGSGVTLNTDSLLRVSYTATGRFLKLERGEVYFDVASDRARPFRVSVEDREVRALGTAFSIRRHDHTFDLVVTEGTVEVAGKAQAVPVRITHGERVSVPRGRRIAAVTSDGKPDLTWRDGLLEFKGASLESVVKEFSRYTRKQIIFADDGVKQMRLGGVFKAGDVEALTSAVDMMLPVKVTRITPYLTVLSMESPAD